MHTSEKAIQIAIDGPAASGKSSTAREVARILGYVYIDSGAMYRALTLEALRRGIPVDDNERIAGLAAAVRIDLQSSDGEVLVLLNGEDVSREIRSPEVTRNIKPVAANPVVREVMVQRQRELAAGGGVVMDGRDITSVVLPDAELKIYMQASAEARAYRRLQELQERNAVDSYEQIHREILERDASDRNRKSGPLIRVEAAVCIDTTHLSLQEQVGQIVSLAKKRIAGK